MNITYLIISSLFRIPFLTNANRVSSEVHFMFNDFNTMKVLFTLDFILSVATQIKLYVPMLCLSTLNNWHDNYQHCFLQSLSLTLTVNTFNIDN